MTKAEEKISSYRKFGWKLGLERMRSLCSLLGDPHDALNVIHVAGTNGKGSVCAYLYEVLLAHGYTAGLFTSPGLGDFRSRIASGGEWISEDDLERCTDRVTAAAAAMCEDGGESPTEFEVLTAVALVYFASKDLDFVVLEVGLGGSADSTNIISSPLVSVITEIGLDHTEHLGDTLEKIAGEKAGIIKPGRPVVTSATGKAAEVIAKRAYGLGAPLVYAHADIAGTGGGGNGGVTPVYARADRAGANDSANGGANDGVNGGASCGVPAPRGIRTRIASEGLDGTLFSCEIRGSRYDNIPISMPGRHQVDNAVCALAAFDVLRHMDRLRSSSDALRKGMKAARLPGRFQIVESEPLTIFDGAHNQEGAAALRRTADSLLKDKRILVLTAMMRDKRTDGILKEIHGFADGVVFTETSNERGMDAGLLADAWSAIDAGKTEITVVPSPREAYAIAAGKVRSERYDALVVCGSLYLISDLLNGTD
jgi:dihydrofolate synthase/folylpolyglutamate synthase